MASGEESPPVRIVSGEIESGVVTTRQAIPSSGRSDWPPFRRVSESIATRKRQLPAHAHEHEEVLTYVIEGFASYEREGQPAEQLAPGSARLFTAPTRAIHRIGPVEGASIRWFNLVLGLPRSPDLPPRLQSAGPGSPRKWVDEVEVQPLTGRRGPMMAATSLESEVISFPKESTTFRKVGADRRALVYALAGEGSVNGLAMDAGDSALVDGLPGMAVRGGAGFRAIYAAVPREPARSGGPPSS